MPAAGVTRSSDHEADERTVIRGSRHAKLSAFLLAQGEASRRRTIRAPGPEWFWDRDGDGWGSREWAPGPYGARGGAGASTVTNCLDCDDLQASVFATMTKMVPDCNGNHIADDAMPSTICVGKARWGPIQYGPDGTFSVNLVFADKDGVLWIPTEWAKKDGAREVAMDFGLGTCPRY